MLDNVSPPSIMNCFRKKTLSKNAYITYLLFDDEDSLSNILSKYILSTSFIL